MIFLKMDPDKFSNYNSIDVLGIFFIYEVFGSVNR